MREIKFRAWDLDNHEMYYSHLEESNGEDKIDWRIDCDGVFFEEIQIIDTCPGGKGHKQSREWRKPNQITMQYTGLKDKNGKEIYEGDTLRIHIFGFNGHETEHEFVGKIEWVDGCAGFGIRVIKDISASLEEGSFTPISVFCGLYEESFEIIGNVHEPQN